MKRHLALLALAFSGYAQAQTFQCGTHLISSGASIPEVAAKCGPPTHVDHSSISRSSTVILVGGQLVQSAGAGSEIPVEVWLYNLGPDKLMRQLRFEDGKVVKIETLGYGYIDGSSN